MFLIGLAMLLLRPVQAIRLCSRLPPATNTDPQAHADMRFLLLAGAAVADAQLPAKGSVSRSVPELPPDAGNGQSASLPPADGGNGQVAPADGSDAQTAPRLPASGGDPVSCERAASRPAARKRLFWRRGAPGQQPPSLPAEPLNTR